MRNLQTSKSLFFRPRSSYRLEFSPIGNDNDELIQAIENERREPWSLDPTPDTEALSEFWASVEEDLRYDPTWTSFED
ncbi:MAG: hypothetical protein ABI303_01930 [Candidatus Saccharimonas sp.]